MSDVRISTNGRCGHWNINSSYQNMANEDCDILETRILKGVDIHCIYIWTGKYLMSESIQMVDEDAGIKILQGVPFGKLLK